jgi:phosphatidate cytidylyltransferase
MIDKKNLKKRLAFAIPAIPVGWWLINSNFVVTPGLSVSIFPGQIVTLILIIMGAWEYINLLSSFFPKNAFWLSILWLGFVLITDLIGFSIPIKFSLFALLLIVALEAIVWGKKNSGRWRRASLCFSAIVFLYIAGGSILYMFDNNFLSLFKSYNHEMLSRIGIAIIVGSIFMCDTMAYFIGSILGKHHYTNISPNKTIEGSVAGFLTAFLLCSIFWIFFRNIDYPWYMGIFMGIILGIFAQIGDLLVSLIKRYFKTKDASEIIPGHGGILDRFGSIFVAVPALNFFLWISEKLFG